MAKKVGLRRCRIQAPSPPTLFRGLNPISFSPEFLSLEEPLAVRGKAGFVGEKKSWFNFSLTGLPRPPTPNLPQRAQSHHPRLPRPGSGCGAPGGFLGALGGGLLGCCTPTAPHPPRPGTPSPAPRRARPQPPLVTRDGGRGRDGDRGDTRGSRGRAPPPEGRRKARGRGGSSSGSSPDGTRRLSPCIRRQSRRRAGRAAGLRDALWGFGARPKSPHKSRTKPFRARLGAGSDPATFPISFAI